MYEEAELRNPVAEPSLIFRVVAQERDRLSAELRQSTVYFAVRNKESNELDPIGSGVVADLFGTRCIFTAGHVLRDYKDAFDAGAVSLSVNRRSGTFVVDRHLCRLLTPGGDHGADAGVVILPPHAASTYIEFGGFSPVRSHAIVSQMPPKLEAMVAGFPVRALARSIAGNVQRLDVGLMIVASMVVENDGVHAWLHADGRPLSTETGEPIDLGSLKGMSGCGCWSVEIDRGAGLLSLALHGVHTATVLPRLRETPIVHHLRLLAENDPKLKQRIEDRWPETRA